MSGVSGVSGFQNVFDLLDYEPPVSAAALAAIEETEARVGRRLPAALRDWYALEGVVEVGPPLDQWKVEPDDVWFPLPSPDYWRRTANWTEQLWFNFAGAYECMYSVPDSLTAVLAQIDGRLSGRNVFAGFARVMADGYDQNGCMVEWQRTDDPPVWRNEGLPLERWELHEAHFSKFVFATIAQGYVRGATPLACFPEEDPDAPDNQPPLPPMPSKPYTNGLWLRNPDGPFYTGMLDFLGNHLGQAETMTRPRGPITYTFRSEGGTVRVTTDAPGVASPRTAWWVHAQSEGRLEALVRLLAGWGGIGECRDLRLVRDLFSETRAARAVLDKVVLQCMNSPGRTSG